MIRGTKLAAAVVSFILLHKTAKRGGTPTVAAEREQPRVGGPAAEPPSGVPPTSTPPPPAEPELPGGQIQLEPYGGPGGGHHVAAKTPRFKGARATTQRRRFAIPNRVMEDLNINHGAVSVAQHKLYTGFAKTGKPLTWEVIIDIETKALVEGVRDS